MLVASLQATRQRLGAEAVRVERADALQWMARAPRRVRSTSSSSTRRSIRRCWRRRSPPPRGSFVAGGFVYAEAAPGDPAAWRPPGLGPWRAGRAGAVHFQLLRKATPG